MPCHNQAKNHKISAAELWEKTMWFMTDSVAKNLTVEELVSEELGTDHVPKRALCKSHVVEKLDRSNLEVLAEAESKINLRPKMEA